MRLFLHCIGYFSKLVILHLLSKLLTSVVITAIISTRVDQNVLLLTIPPGLAYDMRGDTRLYLYFWRAKPVFGAGVFDIEPLSTLAGELEHKRSRTWRAAPREWPDCSEGQHATTTGQTTPPSLFSDFHQLRLTTPRYLTFTPFFGPPWPPGRPEPQCLRERSTLGNAFTPADHGHFSVIKCVPGAFGP